MGEFHFKQLKTLDYLQQTVCKLELVWHGSKSVVHEHLKRRHVGPLNVDNAKGLSLLSRLLDGAATAKATQMTPYM